MSKDRSKIVRARALPYRLPLRRAWRNGPETFIERCGLLVELETGEGVCGYGDCAPLPSIGTETFAQAQARLQELLHGVLRISPKEALAQLPSDSAFPAARRMPS